MSRLFCLGNSTTTSVNVTRCLLQLPSLQFYPSLPSLLLLSSSTLSWSCFLCLWRATILPQHVPHVLPIFFGMGMPNCSSKTRRRFPGDTLPINIVNIGHVPPVQHILLVAIVHVSDFLCCKPAKSMHHFQVNLIKGIGFANTQHWTLGSSHTLHSVAAEECIQRQLIHHTLSLKLEWCLLSLDPSIMLSSL